MYKAMLVHLPVLQKLSVLQNHPEDCETRLLGRFSRSGVDLKNWHFLQVPGDASILGLGTTLREPALV